MSWRFFVDIENATYDVRRIIYDHNIVARQVLDDNIRKAVRKTGSCTWPTHYEWSDTYCYFRIFMRRVKSQRSEAVPRIRSRICWNKFAETKRISTTTPVTKHNRMNFSAENFPINLSRLHAPGRARSRFCRCCIFLFIYFFFIIAFDHSQSSIGEPRGFSFVHLPCARSARR